MYKKITSYLVLSLFAPLVALGDSSRARLYIPASTNASIEGCTTCEIKASGYAARYIFGNGFGLGLASSKATVTGVGITEYSYDTGPMIDISYTFGSDFTFTVGYGVGSSPTTDVPTSGLKLEGKSAANSILGFGYRFGIYEVLLGLRSVSTTYDITLGGTPVLETESTWNTTDIGVGFTF